MKILNRPIPMLTAKGNASASHHTMNLRDGVNVITQFYSYNTLIAERVTNESTSTTTIYISETFYDYSRTTTRYLSNFLDHNIATTRKRLDSETYKGVSTDRETDSLRDAYLTELAFAGEV